MEEKIKMTADYARRLVDAYYAREREAQEKHAMEIYNALCDSIKEKADGGERTYRFGRDIYTWGTDEVYCKNALVTNGFDYDVFGGGAKISW